jgi:hypothetical protein
MKEAERNEPATGETEAGLGGSLKRSPAGAFAVEDACRRSRQSYSLSRKLVLFVSPCSAPCYTGDSPLDLIGDSRPVF